MLTVFDKALAGFLLAFLVNLNQKYGFHFDVGPNTQSVLTSLIDAAINGLIGFFAIYVVPNRQKTGGGVSPPSGKFGAGNAVIAFAIVSATLLLSMSANAQAADVTIPTKAPTLAQRFGIASDCTQMYCTGPYVGFNFAGVATNANVLGNGINGSLTAGGQNLGGQIGYQFWNGTYFFGPEVFADYTYGGSAVVGGFSSSKFLVGEIVKFGGPLSTFFGGIAPANTTGISAILLSHTLSPYIFVGAAQRPWGTGVAAGGGITFTLDNPPTNAADVTTPHWFLDARYMNIQYTGSNQASPIQTVPQENLVMIGLNYKF